MVDYREILRLASLKYSQRMIEASAGSSRHTMSIIARYSIFSILSSVGNTNLDFVTLLNSKAK